MRSGAFRVAKREASESGSKGRQSKHMDSAVRLAAAETTAQAKQMLDGLLSETEREVSAIANHFEELSRRADETIELAARTVHCLEDKGLASILAQIQMLGTRAREFIHKRLDAANQLSSTVKSEAELVDRLASLTRGQRSVAKETDLLCVMTKIEVAHLGDCGTGFQYLAQELESFSQTVHDSTKTLARRTEERKRESERTSRLLALAIPRIQTDLRRIEGQLSAALGDLKESMTGISSAPARFQECIDQLARQINEVVAALQSHDVSRQQIEHVREALALIEDGMGVGEDDALEKLPFWMAGLAIQSYQMRNTREVMQEWVTQVRGSMDSILRVSSAEFSEIGRAALKQDEDLSNHLAWIAGLEQECQADNAEIVNSASGTSELLRLVREHLDRSKSIRDQMHQLNLNSIVEANRLGTKADVILEISRNIKRISARWSEVTDLSEEVMGRISELIERAGEGLHAFSEGSDADLKEAQGETRHGLEELRAMAACAAAKAIEIDNAAGRMREKLGDVQANADRLDTCVSSVDEVLKKIESVRTQMGMEDPGAERRCNRQEVERMFSRSYTTEVERKVLNAALSGETLPSSRTLISGNDVELF